MLAKADTSTATSSIIWLRLEGAAVFLFSSLLYAQFGQGWLLFVLLLFSPDLFMIGYLRDANLGAQLYNLGHTYVLALLLLAAALLTSWPVGLALGLIWTAHIGLDRALGYGLKRPSGFKDTHLN